MDDPLSGQLLIPFLLILVNAFFTATEIAVLSLNDNKIRKMAEAGDKKAILILKLSEAPNKFLSTTQVCITLSGFLASAFAADTYASRIRSMLWDAGFTALSKDALHTLSVLLITLILSYFTLVLGELTPKRIAMKNPEAVARFSCGLINVIATIFKPAVWLLSTSTNGVLRLFRINPNEDADHVTEEEIRLMLDLGGESGAIEQNERTMIENIFEFNNQTAADVMIHRIDVIAFHVDDTFDEILGIIRESSLSRFPVYDTDIDDIVGVLSTRDFLLNSQTPVPVRKSVREMLRAAYLIPETVQADTLFREMQKRKVHMAIVVDEYGGMSGIVTMEDLLEEIVGNIYDEFDPTEEAQIEEVADNLWQVSGTVDLETLSEALNVPLPLDEEYDTLGGMVFSQLTVIPEDGSTFEITMHQLRIQVTNIADHRVEKALISKVSADDALLHAGSMADMLEPTSD